MIKEVCWGWRGRLIKFCPREITDRQGVNLCFPRKAFVLHQLVCCCQHYDVIDLASVMFGRKPFCRGRVKKFGLMSFFSPHCVYSLVTNDWSVAHFTQSALNARPSALPADVGQTRFWPSWKQNGEITIHPETEKLLQI